MPHFLSLWLFYHKKTFRQAPIAGLTFFLSLTEASDTAALQEEQEEEGSVFFIKGHTKAPLRPSVEGHQSEVLLNGGPGQHLSQKSTEPEEDQSKRSNS